MYTLLPALCMVGIAVWALVTVWSGQCWVTVGYCSAVTVFLKAILRSVVLLIASVPEIAFVNTTKRCIAVHSTTTFDAALLGITED